jgi:hypothetical protein
VQRESHEDIIILDWPEEDRARESAREAELAAFRACRFQQGFASEGMLCNEPPIPLRVLDFLEAQDILRLSLVSKCTHQAAHVLFKREVCAVLLFLTIRYIFSSVVDVTSFEGMTELLKSMIAEEQLKTLGVGMQHHCT